MSLEGSKAIWPHHATQNQSLLCSNTKDKINQSTLQDLNSTTLCVFCVFLYVSSSFWFDWFHLTSLAGWILFQSCKNLSILQDTVIIKHFVWSVSFWRMFMSEWVYVFFSFIHQQPNKSETLKLIMMNRWWRCAYAHLPPPFIFLKKDD